MIFLISYGDQRLAVTVQPSRKPSGEPSSPPFDAVLADAVSVDAVSADEVSADEVSVLLFGHSLGKALSQTFGARA